MLVLDRQANELFNGAQCFEPKSRSWIAKAAPATAKPIELRDAVRWLQHETSYRLRPPIAVIGPRAATAEQCEIAETIGAGLAKTGLAMVCGGRQGIMEAACRGVAAHGGIAIGLLPETEPDAANPYVTVPIATGIGEARNALVARAAFCLIAIGDSYGTLSEVALGLQFGKRVIGLCGAAQVNGVNHVTTSDEALDAVARLVLAL